MRVACVMMQRNERLCLRPWLVYHGHLFGYENLFVIDHGSDDDGVKATLASYERLGTQVERLSASADYRDKGKFVSDRLIRADATHLYDFLFPLDCDEFVTMRTAMGHPSCAREQLLDYLLGLVDETAPLLVPENFLNIIGHSGSFWALPYQKVFFTGGHGGAVDHGSHLCTSRDELPVRTRIAYTHFHHKPFAMQLETAREKLRPYVDVDDRAALEAYRGTGWHLVTHLLKSPDEYMAIMRPDARSISFPTLGEIFATLGIDPNFCDP